MTRLEKEIEKNLNDPFIDFSSFIVRKKNHKLFRKKNRREIIKKLPFILEKTNAINDKWLYISSSNEDFFQEKDFLDTFMTNLDKVKNKSVLETCVQIFTKVHLTEEQADLLIAKILGFKYELTPLIISTIYNAINKTYPNKIENMLVMFITNKDTSQVTIETMLIYELKIEVLEKNIDFILENLDVENVLLIKKRTTSEIITEKINNKIKENPEKYISASIKNLYYKMAHIKKTDNKERQKNIDIIVEVVYLIIKDICKNEKVNFQDIKLLDSGTYSQVIEVGNKILKIGSTRATNKFPNNPYITSILLRKTFEISDASDLFVEVTEKVDTKTEVTEEELYQLYKKLRDIKLIWADIAPRNVGRLTKDNKAHWRQELPITDERLGLDGYIGNEQLKKGDLVILDNDHIFSEDTDFSEIKKCGSSYLTYFEKRYQNEKKINNNQEDKQSLEVRQEQKKSRK